MEYPHTVSYTHLQRVPTPTGSTTILTAVVKGHVTVDEINAAMKAASTESFGYNTDEIVSSDIVGMRYGSLFDATQTMVLPLENGTTEVQVVSWYDNENSYTSQMVRTCLLYTSFPDISRKIQQKHPRNMQEQAIFEMIA